jgi:hypothetical protein
MITPEFRNYLNNFHFHPQTKHRPLEVKIYEAKKENFLILSKHNHFDYDLGF